MSELSKIPHFESMESANNYVEEVRKLYRNEQGEYCGRRSPDQKAIAEAAKCEAELLINGMVVGALALGACNQLPPEADDFSYGNHTWADFKNELDRKSTRLNSSHVALSRMPSSA